MNLEGQVALVTGSTSPLGSEIIRVLAKEGTNVVIHYHNKEEEAYALEQEIKNKYNIDTYVIKCDITDENEVKKMVDKVINLRIFDDKNGVMNKSIIDVGGSILSISQFTLYADTTKGRRPSYIKALNGEKATILYDEFNNKLRKTGINIETGIFGADMKVNIINDGPITIMLEK